jgi:hypothetical protein
LLAITVALSGFFAQAASAQTSVIPQNVTVKVGSGDTLSNPTAYLYVNSTDCQSNVDIVVTIGKSLLPATTSVSQLQKYEVWRGTSSCKALSARQKTSSGQATCTQVFNLTTQSVTPTIKASARAWFANESSDKTCTATAKQYITIIAASGDTPAAGGTDNALGSTDIIFNVDVTPYEAPTLTSVSGGESSLKIKYKDPGGFGVSGQDKTYVYFDFHNVSPKGSECMSEAFATKKVPDPSDMLIERKTGNPSSASIDPNDLDNGLALGEQVPVAVAAVDAAGNVSTLSNFQCVVHESTTGFNDACQSDPKCKDQFDQCSTSPWRRASGLTCALLLMLGSLVFVRRKRRNV